jgi:hypothetical protein
MCLVKEIHLVAEFQDWLVWLVRAFREFSNVRNGCHFDLFGVGSALGFKLSEIERNNAYCQDSTIVCNLCSISGCDFLDRLWRNFCGFVQG